VASAEAVAVAVEGEAAGAAAPFAPPVDCHSSYGFTSFCQMRIVPSSELRGERG